MTFSLLIIEIIVTGVALFALLLIFLLKKPQRGWFLYPVMLAVLPFYVAIFPSKDVGFQARVFIPLIMLPMTVFSVGMIYKMVIEKRFEKGPLFYPLLFFLLANGISLLASADPGKGLMLFAAWGFLFLIYIGVYNTVDDFQTVRRFVTYYIGACLFLSLLGMINYFVRHSGVGVNPFASEFEKNHFAILLEQVFFLSFILAMSKGLRRFSRAFYFLCFLVFFVSIVFSGSRGCWVATGAALLYSWLSPSCGKEIRLKLTGGLIIVVLIGGLSFTRLPDLGRKFQSIWSEEHGQRRYSAMAAFETFLHHPVLGVGLDNYDESHVEAYLPQEHYFEWKRISGTLLIGITVVYLRVLTETGLVGFAVFVWIIVAIYRELVKKLKLLQGRPFERGMVAAFLLGIIANLVHFLSVGELWPVPWLYFWFSMALAKVVDRPVVAPLEARESPTLRVARVVKVA